uniref:Sulfotransfer_1 domain-containing protein n=1 Tax=Strongyloides stercoralis TaxID=6248 RepID=A0AAF5DAY4_STRER
MIDKNSYTGKAFNKIKESIYCLNYKNGLIEGKNQYLVSPVIEFMGSDKVNLLPSPKIYKTHLDLTYCSMSNVAKYIIVVRVTKNVLVIYYYYMKLDPSYKFEDDDINVFFKIFVTRKIEFVNYFNYFLG